jgi:hypothetical protein
MVGRSFAFINGQLDLTRRPTITSTSFNQQAQAGVRELGAQPRGMNIAILRIMRTRTALAATIAIAVLMFSCSPETKPAPSKADAQKTATPSDESRRFSKTNLVETKVVDRELMGKSFMPGGTMAHYKRGKLDYDMFVARMPSVNDAVFLLPDWRKALTGAKLEASFGGYYGMDAGRPVFVFSKGSWIAGIVGLPEKDADTEARTLASRLD